MFSLAVAYQGFNKIEKSKEVIEEILSLDFSIRWSTQVKKFDDKIF